MRQMTRGNADRLGPVPSGLSYVAVRLERDLQHPSEVWIVFDDEHATNVGAALS